MKNTSTGNNSTGNGSTGNWSTGNNSTGNCSTGNGSTGYCSTGYCSTGDGSTGNWSISDRSAGHFSTQDYSGFGAFNKPCTVAEWDAAEIPNFLFFDVTTLVCDIDMTDKEKEDFTSYKTIGGYLKVIEYKQAFRNSYNNASSEEKSMLLNLPNFDADVFLEISGIDVRSGETQGEKREKLITKEFIAIIKELLAKAESM